MNDDGSLSAAQPEDVGAVPDWTNEYEAWAAEQDDADEVNRLLREAEDEQA